MKQLAHIYTSRYYPDPPQIQLLCTGKFIECENESEISHRSGGYKINGVHQWSFGAGHNSDCPECLLRLAERKMKTDQILTAKILKIARGKINGIHDNRNV